MKNYNVCNVRVEIVNEEKQVSKKSFPIHKNDIKEILSEIDELDKEILGIGKSNVKRNIKISESSKFRNSSYCLIYLGTMNVWIPVTELGKLRCQLMEYIYDDYVKCQIAAAKGNNNEKNNEYGQAEEILQAKKILEEYDKWATAVKEQKKCQREALRTAEAFEKAEEFYQQVKSAENLYNSEIKKIFTVFSTIIPDLACFAGCRTNESYPDIAASLENKRRHLKAYLYRNKDVLDDLKEIPPFPDLETMPADSDMEQNGMEEDDVNADIPEEFREFIEELERRKKNMDNGNYDEELGGIWDGGIAKKAYSFLLKGVHMQKEGESLWTQEKEKDIEKTKLYRTEAEKIRKRILSYEKHWIYAHLFCMAYPIVKEIDEYPEGEMGTDWCKTISERLYQLLEDFNKESSKYLFQWISYNDKECLESEDIKINFVAGEARWPGLYLCYEDDNYLKHFICVTPGSVLDA